MTKIDVATIEFVSAVIEEELAQYPEHSPEWITVDKVRDKLLEALFVWKVQEAYGGH